MGKGSSGGGGGGSGVVDYPDYMETIHGSWLDNGGSDTATNSVTDAINSAYGSSPWSGETAYDPSADITAYEAAITAFAAILAGITDTTDWAALYTQAIASVEVDGITDDDIDDDVDAFADVLDDEITAKVLPRFQAGMRDINAVVSSAFVIGQAIIEGFRDRDVAKHGTELRVAAAKANLLKDVEVEKIRMNGAQQMLHLMLQRISWEESYMKTVIEGKRIKIVAEKEETDINLKIGEKDGLWDLSVFQYGANVLAAIGGGTSGTNEEPSMMQSMLGGAMGGAAMGAMVGGGVPGAVIGGVLGAASAFL